jgi:hypothetical protein
LVLHFLKSRGKGADSGRPRAGDLGNLADPATRENRLGYRWHSFFEKLWRQTQAIGNALSFELELHNLNLPQEPQLLGFLRGIDVCRDEPGVPTWVVAPLFREVRRRVQETQAGWRSSAGIEFPPLRTTAHVGEDFVHLATGLRYMDEALHFLPLSAGDRVGHGLALGVEPVEWAKRSTRLAMPREDRWFDLVWERHWHAEPSSRFSSARRAYVEDEIVRLSRRIFGKSADGEEMDVHQAIEFVCHLHDFDVLQKLGFPNGQRSDNRPKGVDGWLEQYLTSSKTYQNGRTVEWVESGRDAEAVSELQRLVRRRFAELGITIEVNPISNLLVGDLSDLESHPLWRLAPGLGHDEESTLRICVGSDDPFPFATSLPEEYQFLFDSLVLAGKSQAEARAWLDMVRRVGMESRFTEPAS